MSDTTETRMIMISPTSDITPDQLVRFVHSLGLGLGVKETCYGINIQGPVEDVGNAFKEIRNLDPNRIFSKVRAFPIGDERRCRAHHGSRPGYPQLEKEWSDLPKMDHALTAMEAGEPVPEKKKPQPISIERFKEIIDEVSQ